MAEDDNIVKRTCKELNISQEELISNGSEILMNFFLSFEKSETIDEAKALLIKINTMIDNFEISKKYGKPIFVMPLTNNQNKTKFELYYPAISIEIKSSLYLISKYHLMKLSANDRYYKQTDFIKDFNLDKEKVTTGIYFLNKYGLVDRLKIKNRIHFKLKDTKC